VSRCGFTCRWSQQSLCEGRAFHSWRRLESTCDAETSSCVAEPQLTERTRPAWLLSVESTLRAPPAAAQSLTLPSAELLAAAASPPPGAADMPVTCQPQQALKWSVSRGVCAELT